MYWISSPENHRGIPAESLVLVYCWDLHVHFKLIEQRNKVTRKLNVHWWELNINLHCVFLALSFRRQNAQVTDFLVLWTPSSISTLLCVLCSFENLSCCLLFCRRIDFQNSGDFSVPKSGSEKNCSELCSLPKSKSRFCSSWINNCKTSSQKNLIYTAK